MSRLVELYHRLPAGRARSVAATLRGGYLRLWRYGPETDRLVEEALDRERWSEARWRAWQEEQLGRLLHRAATRVPYYRRHWTERRRRGDRASWEELRHWPLLSKQEVRGTPRAFVADDRTLTWMFREHTSGTTGTPVTLWWSRADVRRWYALFEARCRRWHGMTRGTPWGMLGGQLVAPVTQRHPPYWVWNAALHQLYMSVYHLSPSAAPAYVEAMRHYDLRYLYGYTSALHALALAVDPAGWRGPPLVAAFTNAEPVFAHQRMAIEQSLGCPVRETYGMAEAVAAASECEQGQLHLWPEAGHMEILEADAGGAGELVCTGLVNMSMPLVRYRVGDRVALLPDASPCRCGRTLPRLAQVEGRQDDVLYTPDGRPVGRLDPVFKAAVRVREAQIVQEARDRLRVRLVPADGYGPDDQEVIVKELRLRMGPIDVTVEVVDAIPRSANGKFKAVVSQLPPEQRGGAGMR